MHFNEPDIKSTIREPEGMADLPEDVQPITTEDPESIASMRASFEAALAKAREEGFRQGKLDSAKTTKGSNTGYPRLSGKGYAEPGIYDVHGVVIPFPGGSYMVGSVARPWPALQACEACGALRSSNILVPDERGIDRGVAFLSDSDHAATGKNKGVYIAAYPAGAIIGKGAAPLVVEGMQRIPD